MPFVFAALASLKLAYPLSGAYSVFRLLKNRSIGL